MPNGKNIVSLQDMPNTCYPDLSLPRSTTERRGKGRPRAFDREDALRKALHVFWRKGYEPASVAELCKAMEINPPSLYAGFGNKASLFIEAVLYYEQTYWEAPARAFFAEPDIFRAVSEFFATATRILFSADTPCGCMVVLAAINISERETDVIEALHKLRQATRSMFAKRLQQAVQDRQISSETNILALAGALNTLLEGLSLQMRDGLCQEEVLAIAAQAVHLLPR